MPGNRFEILAGSISVGRLPWQVWVNGCGREESPPWRRTGRRLVSGACVGDGARDPKRAGCGDRAQMHREEEVTPALLCSIGKLRLRAGSGLAQGHTIS